MSDEKVSKECCDHKAFKLDHMVFVLEAHEKAIISLSREVEFLRKEFYKK